MTLRDDIIKEAKKQSTARGKLMFLGNGTIVPVPGTLNQVYATDIGGRVQVVFNGVVPNLLGYPVWVKLVDKKMQVSEAWNFYNNYVAPKIGPHWWTHAWTPGATDIVPISGDQFSPWLVQPSGAVDFTINIIRTPINASGGWVAGGTETHDMTSHIPGSGACYVLLSVNAAGAVVETDGGTEASPSALTIADYPALPSGNKPLYLIMLYDGMTAPLQDNPSVSNFTDVRWMQAGGGGSGGGDVFGSASVTDGHLAVFDVDGYHIKDGGAVPSGLIDWFEPGEFTAGAYDDKFNSSSLDGSWTIVNSSNLTVDTNTTVPSCLALTSTDDAAVLQGVLKTLPSGHWQITARVLDIRAPLMPDSHSVQAGIFVTDLSDMSGEVNFIERVAINDGGYTEDTRMSPGLTVAFYLSQPFLRLRWDGSDIWFEISEDGALWSVVGSLTPASTPLYGGLFIVDNYGTADPQSAAFDWFKVETI
jgi:hypothetical protein